MSVFRWSFDLHGIGIEEIDQQHRRMVELANELYVAMIQLKNEKLYKQKLDELAEFSLQHFEQEEMLMVEAGYPGLEHHRLEHLELTRQLAEFAGGFRIGRDLGSGELITFLTGWLISHSENSDRQFGLFSNAACVNHA